MKPGDPVMRLFMHARVKGQLNILSDSLRTAITAVFRASTHTWISRTATVDECCIEGWRCLKGICHKKLLLCRKQPVRLEA
jgi:hypothetical protein